MSRRFKLTAAILALVLALLAVPALSEGGIPGDYQLAAQNSRFNLYLKQDTLAIIVESRESGKLLYSTVQDAEKTKDQANWKGFYQSGIVMEYIEDVQSTSSQADFINSPSEITYDFTDNGFTAHVRFPGIGISYDAVLMMDEAGFRVRIPQKSIAEESSKYTVSGFYVYPFLGHSYLGEDEGYMIIPDGQGAIIELKDNEGRYSSPFSRPVYGTNHGVDDTAYTTNAVDAAQVIMPVFGMVHTADQMAFLGVVEEGDVSARILAYPNGATRLNYDWVCAKYTYRTVYAQPTGPSSGTISMRTEHPRQFDIVQRFLLEDGTTANYAGLACAYRNHLEEKGCFANAENRPFDVEIDFLGLEKENYVLGRKDVVMTSFDQAGDMLEELHTDGVDNISVCYLGWQADGYAGALPTDGFTPAEALGGRDGFLALQTCAAAMGYPVALEANFLDLNPDTHPVLAYSAFKRITSQTLRYPSFGKVYGMMNWLTPTKSLELAKSVLKDMKESGVDGVSLTGITQLMSDYFYKEKYQDSSVLAGIYTEIARTAQHSLSTTLTNPNAYLWSCASALNGLPVGGSDYAYTTQEIPFLAIATSGKIPCYTEYTNFQANTKRFFLRLVEQGTRPSFLITWEDPIKLQNTNSNGIYSSRYELYRSLIAAWYQELSQLHQAVDGASIIRHDQVGTMVRVTWDNGTRVYLNFGEKPGTLDGVTLEKLSYKVVNSNGQ